MGDFCPVASYVYEYVRVQVILYLRVQLLRIFSALHIIIYISVYHGMHLCCWYAGHTAYADRFLRTTRTLVVHTKGYTFFCTITAPPDRTRPPHTTDAYFIPPDLPIYRFRFLDLDF